MLTGPAPHAVALSPDNSFFAVTPVTMRTLLRTAQHTIAMGLNAHMAYCTLELSDVPTARGQNQRAWYFDAAPSTHSVVFVDGYYAVKPDILAALLGCYSAALRCQSGSASPPQDPNSSPTNVSSGDADDDTDDDDNDDDGGDDGDDGDGAIYQAR